MDNFVSGSMKNCFVIILATSFIIPCFVLGQTDVKSKLDQAQKLEDQNKSIEIIYHFDREKFDGGSRHPRCIFSIKGGLQFDQGFQTFNTNQKNLIRWMSKMTLKPFQSRYIKYFHSPGSAVH